MKDYTVKYILLTERLEKENKNFKLENELLKKENKNFKLENELLKNKEFNYNYILYFIFYSFILIRFF